MHAGEGGRCLAIVQHFSKEVYSQHGCPFLFPITDGEPVAEVRARLAAAMNTTVAAMAKVERCVLD